MEVGKVRRWEGRKVGLEAGGRKGEKTEGERRKVKG